MLATSAIEAVRVALTAEQVEARGLPTAPPKRSDSCSRSWRGGTRQHEALPPDVLARLVWAAILDHFDKNLLDDVLEVERAERAELLGLPSGGSS